MSKLNTPSERGQAATEFALVAPILFLVIFGIIQMGIVFGKQVDLKAGTREAARKAAVSMHEDDPVALTTEKLHDAVALTDNDDLTISVTPAPPWNHGDRITVRASTPHEYHIMGIVNWTGTLRAESEIRVE